MAAPPPCAWKLESNAWCPNACRQTAVGAPVTIDVTSASLANLNVARAFVVEMFIKDESES
jgi:hypothetical protein